MDKQANTSSAREAIFQSIRSHLASSVPHDLKESELHDAKSLTNAMPSVSDLPVVELFKESLEAVDGHCIPVQDDAEVIEALTKIITRLQSTSLRARRIAISDATEIPAMLNGTGLEFEEIAVTPSASDVFSFDVGISRVQAAIAETGTLLLDSSRERHRLVSLVPPVHIALVDASQIVLTLGEALALLKEPDQVSPIVTLVTGPSRTADIELTLAIGVHGPQELYVIVVQSK